MKFIVSGINLDDISGDFAKKLLKEAMEERVISSLPLHMRKEKRGEMEDKFDEQDLDDSYMDLADLHSEKVAMSNLPEDAAPSKKNGKKKK